MAMVSRVVQKRKYCKLRLLVYKYLKSDLIVLKFTISLRVTHIHFQIHCQIPAFPCFMTNRIEINDNLSLYSGSGETCRQDFRKSMIRAPIDWSRETHFVFLKDQFSFLSSISFTTLNLKLSPVVISTFQVVSAYEYASTAAQLKDASCVNDLDWSFAGNLSARDYKYVIYLFRIFAVNYTSQNDSISIIVRDFQKPRQFLGCYCDQYCSSSSSYGRQANITFLIQYCTYCTSTTSIYSKLLLPISTSTGPTR